MQATEDFTMVQEIGMKVLCVLPPKAHVVHFFSGGLGSTVIAKIFTPLLEEKLHCVVINTGGLCDDEVTIRRNAVAANCPLTIIDAKQDFFNVLNGIDDPLLKLAAFGSMYTKKALEVAAYCRTSYTMDGSSFDTSMREDEIWNPGLTHFRPLENLRKDEIRTLARALKLPEWIIEKKPLSDPGYFARIIGMPITEKRIDILQWANKQVCAIVENSFGCLHTIALTRIKNDGPYAVILHVKKKLWELYYSMFCMDILQALHAHPEISRVWFDFGDEPISEF